MRFPIFMLIAAAATATLSSAASKAVTNRQASANSRQNAIIGAPKRAMTLQNADQLQVIAPGTPIMPVNAAAERNRIAAKPLPLDSNGRAHLSGSIRGLGMDIYHFSAPAGSRIRILDQRAGALQFAIFRPGIGMRFGNNQILPQSGNYELRIINDRKNAAHNRKAYPYSVTFTLSPGGRNPLPPARMTKPVATTKKHSLNQYHGQKPGGVRATHSAPPARTLPTTAQGNVARPIRIPPSAQQVAIAKPAAKSKAARNTISGQYRQYRCDSGTITANISANSASVRSGSLLLALAKRGGNGNNVVYSNGVYILTAAADGSQIYSFDLKSVNGTRRLASACR